MVRWKIIVLIFLSSIAAAAQIRPRDYAISLPRVEFSADQTSALVSFVVSNQGGDAIEASQVVILENLSGDIQVMEDLPILANGGEQAYAIELRLADLPEPDLFFKIEAGIDDYELAGSPIARNNVQIFRINQADFADANDRERGNAPAAPVYDLYVPLVNLGINFLADGIEVNGSRYSGGDLLGFAGVILAALFCLWLLSLLLRLIFRRPPKFEPWQPPYAVSTWYDPNSALGRRQSWQFHAQNCTIDAPRLPNQVAVIKRLTDEADRNLGGWTIKAVRTVQYDIYGRISRSEVVMPGKIGKRLTRIAKRAPGLDRAELRKAIEPVAQRLCRYALGAVEKQNRMLPLAMDMRFEGLQGEARVHFELYQYRSDAWHLIDQWEPEMGKLGARIPEHFTFSLNGQLPGENYREFRARLREDVTQLLVGLVSEREVDSALAGNDPGHAQAQSEPSEGDGEWWSASPDDETDAR